MAFLPAAQELSASSEPSGAPGLPCRGPGPGSEEEGPAWTPGGPDAGAAAPGPSGPAGSSGAAGSSSSCGALSSRGLSASALDGRRPGAHLGAVRALSMPASSRAARRATLPARDAELGATLR